MCSVSYFVLAGTLGTDWNLCRALQLHPTAPALFILASSHELEQLSPSAARALLQRGLRMNPESAELWTEYVKMELGYIESLRRRWEVLGINTEKAPKGEDESEGTRKLVMQGAIVRAVLENAVKGVLVDLRGKCSDGVYGSPTYNSSIHITSNSIDDIPYSPSRLTSSDAS